MTLDLERYRTKLVQEREVLTQDIGTIADVASPIPADSSNDVIEVAQHAPVMEVGHKVIDMKANRLEAVNAALQSIADGSYGVCKNCGKQIDLRRLDAEPAALTCVECMSAEEQNFQPPKM